MKNIFSYKFWLYYSAILAGLLIISGFFISNSSRNLIIANILFVPVVLFLWLSFWKYRKFVSSENSSMQAARGITGSTSGFWLLVYSVFLTTVITVGGFASSRSNIEIVSNAIFLPITIFCWYAYYIRPKKTKSAGVQSVGGNQNGSMAFNSGRMQNRNWDVNQLRPSGSPDYKNRPNRV
jgi:hypothetical protein